MVIDILKTEDAQTALQESSMKMAGTTGLQASSLLTAQDQEQLKLAVKEVLVSPDYDTVIKKLMIDPRFAGEFATAVNKQNKQIHKDLLKDPSYQQDLITVMKNPEMDKMILQVLQSTQYRKQVLSIVQEGLQSPLVKLELLELMRKAVQEELQPAPNQQVQKQDSQGSQDQGQGQDQQGQDKEKSGQEEDMGGMESEGNGGSSS